MEQIVTKILIDASPVRIWKTLTDFSSYPKWNPFILEALGVARRGNRLTLSLARSGDRTMIYRPFIVDLEWGRRLVLQGQVFHFPGLMGAEHFLLINNKAASKRVQLTQKHVFHGAAAAIAWKRFAPPFCEGIRAMNEALKEHIESTKRATETRTDREIGGGYRLRPGQRE